MSRLLIVFASTDGHTRKIASHLQGVLQSCGHDVTGVDARQATGARLADYDGALVGGSVHMGQYQSHLISFVRKHRDALAAMPSAFFSVSMSAASRDPDEARKAAQPVEGFIHRTGWHPPRVELVAGALPYTRYGFIKRVLMRFIASRSGGDTDTSRDFEYTDWNALSRFATEFAASLPAPREHAAVGHHDRPGAQPHLADVPGAQSSNGVRHPAGWQDQGTHDTAPRS